jgi:hypothetical protein
MMPRKQKPPGREKWSWEEINQGRKHTQAERADRWAAKNSAKRKEALIAHLREEGIGGPLSPEQLADVLGTIRIKATIVVGKPPEDAIKP